MKLHDLIHAPTRPAWTARLVLYLVLIGTVALVLQTIHLWF